MTQESNPIHRLNKTSMGSNTAVSVVQSGNTELLVLDVSGTEKLSVQVTCATQALDVFLIEGQVHKDAAYFTIASAAASYTAVSGRMLYASTDMTVLAASATGRVDIDVSGLVSVRFSASGGNTTASVVSIYATAGAGLPVAPASTGSATAPSANVVTTQPPAVTEVRSTALETSHVLKASAGQLRHLSVFNSKGSAQFILIMNSATLPGDGAVTLLYPPIPIAAGALVVLDFPAALVASTGITVSNSSTGSFTKTIGSADCAFYAQVN